MEIQASAQLLILAQRSPVSLQRILNFCSMGGEVPLVRLWLRSNGSWIHIQHFVRNLSVCLSFIIRCT